MQISLRSRCTSSPTRNRERGVRLRWSVVLVALAAAVMPVDAQKYVAPDGRVRVALAKQPFSPNGLSKGPSTMADGGIQKILAELGTEVRIVEARLTAEEDKEYGGWKRLGMALGH